MNETQYTNKVNAILKKRGAYFEKIWGGGMQSAGIPDILVCYRGVFVGLELKVKNNKPSELQKAKVQLIRDAGGIGAIVWDRVEPVEYILDTIDSCMDMELPLSRLSDLGSMYSTKEDSYEE